MSWRRVVPVLLLGGVFVAYVVVRPALAGAVPHLSIWEYPAGLLLGALLVGVALRRPRAERPVAAPAWTRHRQVVRAVPDAEAARMRAPLDAWVERGVGLDEAALVVAKARARDAAEAERIRPEIASLLAGATTPRSRRKLLNALANEKPPTGA